MDSICVEPISPSTCYSFDEQLITQNETQHTFNLYGNGNAGFLQNWKVVSGTPSIYKDGLLAGVNAFEGSQYALQAICSLGGDFDESVSLSYPFQQGHSYSFSMALRNNGAGNNPTPIDIDFILLADSIPYLYNSNTGCSQIPNTPIESDTIFSISSFSQDSWQLISFSTPILSLNYNHLWLRAKFSPGAAQATTFFLLDSFCVTQIPSLVDIQEDSAPVRLRIVPNPACYSLAVETDLSASNYSIQDITGKELSKGHYSKSNNFVDVSNLAEGIYFYVLHGNFGHLSKKFLVLR